MKKTFTILIAALMLLTMISQPTRLWGQTRTTMIFDFEDSGAHTTTTNAYTSHTYSENGFNIGCTYFDCISNNGIGGSYLARGRVAKKTTNHPILEIGPINVTGWTITSITYYTKGNADISQVFSTKTNGDASYTEQISSYTSPTSSTQKTANVSISGKTSLYLRWEGSVSSQNNSSNRDFDIDDIVITYTTSGGGSSAAATTTTIDYSGITNTDVYTSTAAGSLSASVTSGGEAVQGATVTWSGNNNAVATINASTGAVTLVSAGTVKFTASYAGVANQYQASSADYDMTVTSSAPSYTVTYNSNGGTGTVTDPDSPYNGGANVTVLNNQFRKTDCGFVKWNTQSDGLGFDYLPGATISSINANVDLYAQWETLTYNFGAHTDFATWTNAYNQHTLEYSDADVVFASANKPSSGSAIEDQPVTKGGDVELKLQENGATMSKVTFFCTQWGNKTQTITLQYSTNGGTSYSAFNPAVTSSTFTITKDNLPEGTNAVKITFSNSSNQVGILGATITKIASTNPTLAANDVNLEYNYTQGSSISYTLTNPKEGGAVTAAITSGNTGSWLSIGAPSNSNASGTVALTCSTNNTTTARTATVTLTYTYNTKLTVTKDVVITQAAHPIPSITASDVNINGDATNGSIAYEINDGITGGSLSASTTSTWLTPGVVTNEAVPFTCEANQGAARSATVVLTYTYNTNQTVTKNVTVTQAKAPYTTIPAMFAGATSTSTSVDVTFGGWVVSGVSTNGKNVFVTDNEGHGFNIYDNGGNMGFSVGDILTGTVTCNLKKNNGYAQLLNLNSSTSGISIGTEGTLTVADIAMANLSGVNTGALVHYENLTGSSSSGNYYLSDGTTTIQIYGSLSTFSIAAGKTYDITGIYQQYSNTKEVLPRSANDIVLKADMSLTDFSNLTAFSYVLNQGPSAAQHIEVYCDDLGDNTLRATAPQGYEVCSTENGTYAQYIDMTPSQGAVAADLYIRLAAGHNEGIYNGNLSFTATTLDAVNVPLQGSVSTVATYAISLVQTTGGTIAADKSVASEGTTVTLSYSDLDDCYDFTRWTVYKTGEPGTTVTVTNNQFGMPGYPVTATATFTQKTYTLDYYFNGNVVSLDGWHQDGVTCGTEVTLKSASDVTSAGITIPTGFTFAGWSTSANSTTTVSSVEVTANTTLYAVLVPTGSGYQLITSASQITAGTYLIGAFGSTTAPDPLKYRLATGGINGGDMTVQATGTSATNGLIGTKPNDACEFVLSGNSTDGFTIAKGSDYLGSSAASNRNLDWGSYSSYNWKFTDKKFSNDIEGGVYMQCTVSSTTYRVSDNGTSGNDVIRSYTSNTVGRGFYLFKKIEVTPYTRVYTGSNNATADITISGPTLITSNSVLNMGSHNLECDDASKLVIEDGGQLITSSTGVQATVKKEIHAATARAATYWYAISSAVANPIIASETNIASGTYDLYRYNEAAELTNAQGQTLYWENYKAGHADFTTLEPGRGYLYRNASDLSIAMTGEINVADFNYHVTKEGSGVLAGFNLIGNPYSHDIYKGLGTAIPNGSGLLRTGFYYMEPTTGKWTIGTDNSIAIKPNQGILVQTDKDGDIAMTNTTANAAKYNNDNIMFKVANSQYSDEAYAWFDKGRGLNKISHRNAEVPMIYINQDGEDYAIATMSDDTKMFSLNFKAMTMGKYTLSYKTTGEFSYLHVIDRLTGEDVDMLLEGEYSFVASPSDSDARFIVKLAYLPDYSDGEGDIFAYQNGSDIFVSGEGELQIFDVMGRFVMSERINGVKTISADELSKGVYVLRLVGNGMKTQKIVVK